MEKHIDIAGKRFGRLIVVRRDGITKCRSAVWLCQCDCGKEHRVPRASLAKGLTQSCGCLRKYGRGNPHWRTHGLSNKKNKIYRAWMSMKSRCYIPSNNRFKYYGGKGIQVCEEWRNDFVAFAEYVGSPPSEKHSIDRIDVYGHYAPGNVRWATAVEQQNNRTDNKPRG